MITVHNVTKKFEGKPALQELSLQFEKGSATGIVGPNGSGKTTMIKSMLGLVKPQEGDIFVDDTHVNGDGDYRSKIGYMPQMARYPEQMRVNELLDFIEQVRQQEAVKRDELIRYFELEPELNKPMRALSGGTRQKVGATQALMFDAPILIMDEPTAGLDPRAAHMFKKWIQQEREHGKTLLLTSHIMGEIEALTDQIVFLVQGKLRFQGSADQLVQESKQNHLEEAVAWMMEGAEQ
jgi:Cu-processing system ATP-binding protein